MSARKPPWLYLHDALDRVSARMFQKRMDALTKSQSLSVRHALRDLLLAGDIEAYVHHNNKMIRLATSVMLTPPFGIHYDGDVPGIQTSRSPEHLRSLRLNANNLESSLELKFHEIVEVRPKSFKEKNDEAKHWLIKEMQSGTRLTKTECQEIALAKFDISRKAFLEIWKAAQIEAGVNWSKPGKFKTV
jgi:hypothetical protein